MHQKRAESLLFSRHLYPLPKSLGPVLLTYENQRRTDHPLAGPLALA